MNLHLETAISEPLLTRISRYLAWIAGAFILFGCSLPITIDVIFRHFFNRGLVESFELSGFSFAACIGLGMGYTVVTKSNIRINFLTEKLPQGFQDVANLAAALSLAALASALAWYGGKTLLQTWQMGATSMSRLHWPMVIPQGIWWFGMLWFAVVAVMTLVLAVRRLAAGDRERCEELIGPPNFEDEIEQQGVDRTIINALALGEAGK